jgi:ketosteroid isomerase-like protein
MIRLHPAKHYCEVMNSISPLLFGMVLLAVIGVSHPCETFAFGQKEESVAESMRRLSLDIISAYEKRDVAALKNFYAKQPGALFFWERKMSYSWPEIDSTIDALVSAVTQLKLTTTELRSGGSGNNGWFAATFHVERVTPTGKKFFSDGRWTVVAEKVNGRWLIVHEHTSFPQAEVK